MMLDGELGGRASAFVVNGDSLYPAYSFDAQTLKKSNQMNHRIVITNSKPSIATTLINSTKLSK